MAKQQKRDWYQGKSLFDYMQEETEYNFNSITKGEQNNDQRRADGTSTEIPRGIRTKGSEVARGRTRNDDARRNNLESHDTRGERGGKEEDTRRRGEILTKDKLREVSRLNRTRDTKNPKSLEQRGLFDNHGNTQQLNREAKRDIRQLRNGDTQSLDVLLGRDDGRLRDNGLLPHKYQQTEELRTRDLRERGSRNSKESRIYQHGYNGNERDRLLQIRPTSDREIPQSISKGLERESLHIHGEYGVNNTLDFKAQGDPHIGSPKSRFTKNIEAIKLLIEIEKQNRVATLEEQK
ncbi:hypothetical protein CQA53_09490 [Helicobacter didelphidarum]|uniref:Uncharacterized protein n=1 Tax=Helicobacter didelphidarum TaxID=2040648 RepID=A0A3D8IAE5_9HELI|nr:hypothetical protein [Helicobacter didelphidarum]RDU62107.1 hypothetical protein CQA53_09490 [Helicobacter didelphidarum]